MDLFRLSEHSLPKSGLSVTERTLTVDYPLHWHSFFEIEYVLEGSAVFQLNGKDVSAQSGTAVFITPADLQKIHTVTPPFTVINIMFDERWVTEELQPLLTAGCTVNLANTPLPKMLLREYNQRQALYETGCKHLLNSFLVEIFRLRHSTTTRTISTNSAVCNAQLFLQMHFQEPVTLEQLADRAGFSSAYFSTLFRRETGESFQTYLLNLRLHHAARLVESTDHPLSLICQQAGFGNFAYFSRAFKNRYGISPQQYRNKKREP